jgi:hypothetical protein
MINCHVCGVDRPDDMLGVGVYRFERGGLRMTLRIRYCRWRFGRCHGCGRTHRDGHPLLVARQPRQRRYLCIDCHEFGPPVPVEAA